MTPEIMEFIQRHHNHMFAGSLWFKAKDMAVYLRAGPYVYRDGQRYNAIGIANVQVNPKRQRKGIFTSFLTELIKTANELEYSVVTAEQVHNTNLHALLERNGFVRRPNEGSDITYEKWL